MSDQPVVISIFSNGADAEMAQQLLEDAGVRSFLFKDDVGGMEPQLQLTGGIRLMTSNANAERAREILEGVISD